MLDVDAGYHDGVCEWLRKNPAKFARAPLEPSTLLGSNVSTELLGLLPAAALAIGIERLRRRVGGYLAGAGLVGCDPAPKLVVGARHAEHGELDAALASFAREGGADAAAQRLGSRGVGVGNRSMRRSIAPPATPAGLSRSSAISSRGAPPSELLCSRSIAATTNLEKSSSSETPDVVEP
jgi:hypothetical protein